MFCDSSHWVGDFPSPRPRPILWCGLWNNLRPCDTLAARNIGYINIVGLSLFCLCGKSQLNLLSQYLTMFPVYMIFPMMLLILSIGNGNGHKEECPLWFDCGNHGRFEWPFTKVEHQDCGIWPIHGCDDDLINPNYVLLKIGPSSIKVQKFEMQRFATIVYFTDHHLRNLLQSDSCEIFSYNITLPPSSPLGYFTINNNITLFKCNRTLQVNTPKTFLKNTSCGYDIFMGPPHSDDVSQGSLAACSMVQLPMNGFAVSANPFAFLTAEISVQFLPSDECMQCHHYRGHCHLDSQRKVNCAQRYISNS